MTTVTCLDSLSFEAMAFDELLSLRERLDELLSQRIAAEQQSLQERLARLERLRKPLSAPYSPNEISVKPADRKLPVRYRNPEKPSEVWAGRGLQPRWLKQALKSGKKLSHFLVSDVP